MIRSLKGRIHFAHVRNLKFNSPSDFEEAAHLSSDGSFDMYEIMKTLYDIDFQGPIRPDHGRMIWDEVAMPGYGLYDRALGATYLNGLWEASTLHGIVVFILVNIECLVDHFSVRVTDKIFTVF